MNAKLVNKKIQSDGVHFRLSVKRKKMDIKKVKENNVINPLITAFNGHRKIAGDHYILLLSNDGGKYEKSYLY